MFTFRIPVSLLEEMLPHETTSPHWVVSIIDDRIYLNIDGVDLEADISPLDIWQEYQNSLAEPGESEISDRQNA